MASSCVNLLSGKASSRLFLFTLATATSLLCIERAAAQCVLTSGPGTATSPGTGARVTCRSGQNQTSPVIAAAGSTDVQVTVESGAVFVDTNPWVSIRSGSQITNSAALSSTSGALTRGFVIEGNNSTITNNGSMGTTNGNA
jgi:hypothetical protein